MAYSPYNPLDPFNQLSLPDQSFQPNRQPAVPPLKKDEKDSILSQLGGMVTGGLGFVGGMLDKAGRPVRAGLSLATGGNAAPSELASWLPFSDTLGITSEQNRVSGEDLARQWGVLDGPGTKGEFEFRDLVGPAIEIATDPLSYATFGGAALSRAGRVAKNAGAEMPGFFQGAKRAGTKLADALTTPELSQAAGRYAEAQGLDLASLLDQPLGGHVGLGLPFSHASTTFDASPAIAAAGKAADVATHLIPGGPQLKNIGVQAGKTLAPYGRSLRALFDKSVAGATSVEGQQAGRQFTGGLEKSLADFNLQGMAPLIRDTNAAGLIDQPELLRALGEGTFVGPLPTAAQESARAAIPERMRSILDEIRQQNRARGIDTGADLQDAFVDYLPRQQAQLLKDTKGYTGPARQQQLPTYSPALEGREEILKNIPGGTTALNQLTTDPSFSGLKGTLAPEQLPSAILQNATNLRRKLGMTPEMEARFTDELARLKDLTPEENKMLSSLDELVRQGGTLAPEQQARHAQLGDLARALDEKRALGATFNQGQHLAQWLSDLDPQYAASGTPFFGNHPLEDFARSAASQLRVGAASDAVHDLFGRTAVPLAQATPGSVPLDKALELAGLTHREGALQTALSRFQGRANSLQDLLGFAVPPEAVKDATRYLQGMQGGEALKPLLDIADTVTNLTKAGQTTLWPGFHTRNFLTGLWQNFITGGLDKSSVQDARKLLSGGTIEGLSQTPLFRGLSDEQATQKLADLAMAHRVAGAGHAGGLAGETVGPAEQATKLMQRVPGMVPHESLLDLVKEGVPTSREDVLNLGKIANVGGYTADVSKPVVAGRKLGGQIEDVNRLSGFLAKLRQGVDPAVAGREIRAAHVDYSQLSDFEKSVMRRLVPFYSYTKGMLPWQLENLLAHPGGVTAQTVRAGNDFREQSGFVPNYVGGGLAIPVGQEKEGTQRYLSRLDLPHESIMEMLKTGPHGGEHTLEGLLSQLNPALKAPLEWATGKQFFTGRDLEDLHGATGNTFLDQLLMNSPLSRAYTTGRTILDPRKDAASKAVNLLTGARLTDVDQEKQRDIAARDLVQELLAGEPGVRKFTELYVKPEDLPNLSDRDFNLLRLNKTLEQEGQQRAREAKKKRIGVQPIGG